MQLAMAQPDTCLQAAVVMNGGDVVKMRGDGLHAAFAFASALDALAAALAGQRALQSPERDEAIGQLQVRMGLYTGSAEMRDGDYFGSTANLAARL
jgi:class 3 adenylate cyclase